MNLFDAAMMYHDQKKKPIQIYESLVAELLKLNLTYKQRANNICELLESKIGIPIVKPFEIESETHFNKYVSFVKDQLYTNMDDSGDFTEGKWVKYIITDKRVHESEYLAEREKAFPIGSVGFCAHYHIPEILVQFPSHYLKDWHLSKNTFCHYNYENGAMFLNNELEVIRLPRMILDEIDVKNNLNQLISEALDASVALDQGEFLVKQSLAAIREFGGNQKQLNEYFKVKQPSLYPMIKRVLK